uniref:Uncharacterized protein n=1 Tax=Cucumis melo TaxID=3656 RepID=A0A9I9EAB1_CUCME
MKISCPRIKTKSSINSVPTLLMLIPKIKNQSLSQTPPSFVLPRFTQLTVTSYYATSSASHYGVSLLTRRIEDNHTSQTQQASTQKEGPGWLVVSFPAIEGSFQSCLLAITTRLTFFTNISTYS